jgi:hypothetical protein
MIAETSTLLKSVPQAITAVGGLGTAAFGLVDATKVFGGGINHAGFGRIQARIKSLMPEVGDGRNAVTQADALKTLKGNWFNGTDLSSQKAIAKSLIKMHLNPSNAAALARATNVDPDVLTAVTAKIASGASLSPAAAAASTALTAAESDAFGRFDLIVTALLDETYQMADQAYTNGARALAVVFSIGLALAGAWMLDPNSFLSHIKEAVIVGLVATPLAPIAKDLSSSLAAAVNAMQAVRK